MAAGGGSQLASLYVGDLHRNVTDVLLYQIFSAVAPVASIRVCRDSITRRPLGYAYVNFHCVTHAQKALDTLNYASIKGRACRIMWSQRDPTLRISGLGNLIVKNLDRRIDNKALYDTFSMFGNILSCKVAASKNGTTRGFGFVHYDTEEAANFAIELVNGMRIGDKTVHVSAVPKPGEREPPEAKKNFTNVYVTNYPEAWDQAKMLEVFGELGRITSFRIIERKMGKSFALVNYETSESAKACIAKYHNMDRRTEEQKLRDEAGKEAGTDTDRRASHFMTVDRVQTKLERQKQLSDKQKADAKANNLLKVNLHIKNLDETMTDEALRAIFEPFGTILSANTIKNEKGGCKGSGFVGFPSREEATAALAETHFKVINGKPLYVGFAEKKEERKKRLRNRCFPQAPGSPERGGDSSPVRGGFVPGQGGDGAGSPTGSPMHVRQTMSDGSPGGFLYPDLTMYGGAQPMMEVTGGMGRQRQPVAGRPRHAMGGQPGEPPRAQLFQEPAVSHQPLTDLTLDSANSREQRQVLGEKLYPCVAKLQPGRAGKITSLLMEMDTLDLLRLLASEALFRDYVNEAAAELEGESWPALRGMD